jgi:hypothetical protein
MTLRLTIGIDPGTSGAIGVLADGVPAGVHDMPKCPAPGGSGQAVDGAKLAALLRGILTQHQGADVLVVHELVGGFRGQGGSASFAFGQADGAALGVVAALGLRVVHVRPQAWKKHYGLVKPRGGERPGKDASRARVVALFPNQALPFLRAKDDGRAEALLLALWGHQTEAAA